MYFVFFYESSELAPAHGDLNQYPAGKHRMEPLGVVVFAVVMITSFSQILVQSVQRLTDRNTAIVDLPIIAIVAMIITIVVKAIVWLTYRNFESTSIRGKQIASAGRAI